MAPKSKQQNEEIRTEKRELILNTALEVFASHGFHGASISLIASHAGIAKGLLYNYFESKEQLLKTILNKGIQEIMSVFESSIPEKISPEIFSKLLSLYFQQLRNNKTFWQLYFAIASQPDVLEMIEKEFEPMINPYQEMLTQYYKQQGSRNPEADALLAHAIIDGLTLNFVVMHHNFDLDYIEKIVTERIVKPLY
jgi:AcrR family transcriptional regulator